MNKLPLIEKIHLLESRLGERWNHSILEPFTFDSSNPIQVQETAKLIARHLGLKQFTFIISYAMQSEGIGGHIQLEDSNEVFIEISEKFKNDCDVVLAVLSHEICHKYLQINNIHLFPERENEILTDVATIFTGLGKLSLNGCEKISYVQGERNFGNTIAQSKVGYLNRREFAFVYRLICEMQRIPESVMTKGLTSEAINELTRISIAEKDYFNKLYFNNEYAVRTIEYSINSECADIQINFAKLNRNIRKLQDNILSQAISMYKDFHLYYKNKIDASVRMARKSHKNEAHNYIKNLLAVTEYYIYKKNINEKSKQINDFGKVLPRVIYLIENTCPKHFIESKKYLLLQFECPCCTQKMRIGDNKLAKVKCPKCNYNFIVDTGAEITNYSQDTILNNDHLINNSKDNFRINIGIWSRIKMFFMPEPA